MSEEEACGTLALLTRREQFEHEEQLYLSLSTAVLTSTQGPETSNLTVGTALAQGRPADGSLWPIFLWNSSLSPD